MSQGPFGLAGALEPVPAWVAIIKVAPTSVSASPSIRTRLVLVFILSIPSSELKNRRRRRRARLRRSLKIELLQPFAEGSDMPPPAYCL